MKIKTNKSNEPSKINKIVILFIDQDPEGNKELKKYFIKKYFINIRAIKIL